MPHTFFGSSVDSAMCGGIEVLEKYDIGDKNVKNMKLTRKRKTDLQPKVEPKKKRGHFVVTELNKDRPTKNGSHVTSSMPQKSASNMELLHERNSKKKKNATEKPAINVAVFNQLFGDDQQQICSKNDSNTTNKKLKKDASKVPNTEDLHVKKSKKKKTTINESELNHKFNGNKHKNGSNDTESRSDIVLSSEPKKGCTADSKTEYKGSNIDMSQWREVFVCEEIIKCLEENKFEAPTPIQKLSLPASIKGRMDIVGAAETGSGKTLAFAIPIVQGIMNDRMKEKESGVVATAEDEADKTNTDGSNLTSREGDHLRALILTPTRELALQIKKHIDQILRYVDISVVVVVGGMSSEKQLRLLKRRPEIVVATPGRIWELYQDGVPHLASLPNIRYLAIDETDRMGEKGHFEELQKLLEMVRAESKERNRQHFVMSATLSLVHRPPTYNKGKQLKQKSSKDKLKELMEFVGVSERRKVVDITRKVGTAESLTESVIHCSLEEKDAYLYYFIRSHKGRTIVFCNSIDCVRRLTNLFSYLESKPLPLHAQLHQKQRLKNLERFSSSESGLLLASDVAARGLDIPNIQHVVHYQVPRTSEGYIHRSGRTARANSQGLSVLLIDPSELYLYKKLCVTLNRSEDLPTFPVESNRFSSIIAIMESARRLDQLLLKAKKKAVGDKWMQKAAQEAEIIVSEDEDSDTDKCLESAVSKQRIAEARGELQSLLRTPLESREFGGKYPTMTGCLPDIMHHRPDLSAVESLKSEQAATQKILKGNKAKSASKRKQDLYKGFKKRKQKKTAAQ